MSYLNEFDLGGFKELVESGRFVIESWKVVLMKDGEVYFYVIYRDKRKEEY